MWHDIDQLSTERKIEHVSPVLDVQCLNVKGST